MNVFENLSEEKAKEMIDKLIAEGYSEENAYTEVYAIECNMDSEENIREMENNMNSDDRYEILNEIDSWEKELSRLENSDEDEADEILEIKERISDLYEALADCE